MKTQLNSNNKQTKIINLLISFNQMTKRVLMLKSKDQQALGLLTEAIQINKQMLSLIKDNKINLEFVRQIFGVISILVKEIVSKWLSRCYLTPLTA